MAPAAAASGPIKPSTRAINQAVWYAGFKIAFGTATLHQTGPVSRKVDIGVNLSNGGAGTQTLHVPFELDSAGQHYQLNALTTDLHDVPAQTTGTGLLSFDVDSAFSFDEATVVVGSPAHAQATVPVVTTGRLVTLQPVPEKLSGSVSSGVFKLDLSSGEVRWDSVSDYVEAESGQRFLVLTFNLSTTKSENFSAANLALQLPDGTTAKPDDAPVLILDPGPAQQNETARFTVKDPPSGSYGLVLIDDNAAPAARATLGFSLP